MKKTEPVGAEDILPEQSADELFTVTLKRCHTHAGKMYEAGVTLQVNAAMNRWLIYQGVIDPS